MELIFIIILTGVVGFYMAWNIRVNDVANSMGTSVDSGVITVSGTVFLAAIRNIVRAVLIGTHVTQAISKDIVNPFKSAKKNLLIYGLPGSRSYRKHRRQSESNDCKTMIMIRLLPPINFYSSCHISIY